MCFLLLKYIDFVRWGSVVWEISLDWGVYKVRFGCGEEGGGRLISGDEREILFCNVGGWLMREVGFNELLSVGVFMESRVFLRFSVRDWVFFTFFVCMRLVIVYK